MVHYCINTVICSGLLFFLYKVLLENEKMHVFKRFYLLFAIVLSLVAPLVTIQFSTPANSDVIEYLSQEPVKLLIGEKLSSSTESDNTKEPFLLSFLYLSGVVISLFFFAKSIYYFLAGSSKAESVMFNNAQLVLVNKDVAPHSFLNSIFVNKEAYKKGLIEDEILIHELTHVKQLHSLDVLFAQLVQCIFWFNPFFIFYKRAIQLNHEFLADEAAVRFSNNPFSYQRLLLNKASGKEQFSLASQLNYSIIKKRLVMITRTTSNRKSLFKKLTVLSSLVIICFLFSKKEISAQQTQPTTKTEMPSSSSGASQQLVDEYQTILDKHKTTNSKDYPRYSKFSKEEEERLLAIYKMMSKEQQERQLVRFIKNNGVKPTGGPTNEQLKTWVDAKRYYVRIDGRKIKNEQLPSRNPDEFVQVWVYKPVKGSTDYGKYYAQINLMTKKRYEEHEEWNQSHPYLMVAVNPNSNVQFKYKYFSRS